MYYHRAGQSCSPWRTCIGHDHDENPNVLHPIICGGKAVSTHTLKCIHLLGIWTSFCPNFVSLGPLVLEKIGSTEPAFAASFFSAMHSFDLNLAQGISPRLLVKQNTRLKCVHKLAWSNYLNTESKIDP